ncbi:S-layer homology domain-containing protein [Paenibacillus sp. NPDC057967]|uniref:S-layer homology domain-containing protein n=1 Tax=Paenibacillus sp. NPDC057967 TaxID=3346293 RepID=UPI0036DEE691
MKKKLVAIVLLVASIGLIFTFNNQDVVSANIVTTPIYAIEDTTIVYEGIGAGKFMYEDGGLGYLDVGYQGSFGGPLEVQSLLKYDLPPTPAGYEIESANLYFPVTGGSLRSGVPFTFKASASTSHGWTQDLVTSYTLPAPAPGSTQSISVANNVPLNKPTLGPIDFTSYITQESLKSTPRATFILSGFSAEEAQDANIAFLDHYIQTNESNVTTSIRPYLIVTYTEKISIEITGVINGGVYNTNVTPLFNMGTATINGAFFTSGTTLTVEGSYTLVVTYGSKSETIQFRIDKTPPTGRVIVNLGQQYTNSAGVSVHVTPDVGVNDVTHIRYSVNGNPFTQMPYIPSFMLAIGAANGDKVLAFQLVDGAGNESPIYQRTVTLDTVPPTGSVVINNGNSYTTTREVMLNLALDSGVTDVVGVQYSDNNSSWSGIETFSTSRTYMLPAGDGNKTVYVRLIDRAGNITVIQDSILLDTTAPTGTVVVNDGRAYTNNANVYVDVTPATGVTDIVSVRYTINGAAPTTFAYTDNFTINVGSTDGAKIITIELIDGAGHVSPVYSATVTLDTVAPTGSVVINSGAAYTTAAEVTLNFTLGAGVTDVVGVQFSNDNLTWSSEQAYSASMSYTLSGGDGSKTVYVRFIDRAGNIGTAQDSIVMDTTAPTGTLAIASAITNDTSVTLTVTSGDANFMELGEAGQPYGARVAYSNSAQTYTLQDTQDDGVKTLQVRLSDLAGNTTVLTVTVILDRVAPTGTVVVNNGKLYTNDANVAVEVTPATGVTDIADMRYAINGSTPTTIAYTNSFIIDVGSTDGEKEITVELIDEAGNVSPVYTSTITLDTVAPTGTVAINGGAAYTTSAEVTLNFTLGAGVTDVASLQFSNDNLTWSSEQAYSPSMSYTLPAGDGSKTVYVRFIDRAGNTSAAQDSITLDTTAPTGTLTITSPVLTNDTSVTLMITSSDANFMELGEAGQPYKARAAYSNSAQTYTLQDTEKDGVKTLQVRLSDLAGNTTVLTVTITLDRVAPIGNVVVNEGKSFTNDANVAVEVTPATGVTDIVSMRYTINGSTPTTIAYTNSFILDVGSTDGEKEITVELMDGAGNVSPVYSSTLTLDTEAPTGTVAINAGAAYTTTAEVTLNFTLGAGVNDVVKVQFSNDNLTWSSEQAYSPSMSYTLPAGDGSKTVYVRFIDRAGNTGTAQDSIVMDTTAPTGTLTITSPVLTNDTSVALTVTSSDASFMELGEAGQPYKARAAYSNSAQTYPLQDTEKDGVKTLQVRLSDLAGNTTVLTATVILDRVAPTGNVVVNEGKLYTNDANVTVEVKPATGVTDIVHIRYAINGTTPITIAYTDSFIIDVGSTNEEKKITVELMDGAGNVSPVYTSTLTLDAVAPTGTVAINGGAAYTTAAEVTLNFMLGAGVNDVVKVQISNDNVTWSGEQAYSPSISYTLPAGDGSKTVYVQFIDRAGNTGAAQASITLDTVAPTGQLVINHNDDFTNSLKLELTVTTTSDPSELAGIQFSSDGATWSALEAYTNAKQWSVEGNGKKTVYVRFVDHAGNEYTTSSSIYVDTVKPIVFIAVEDEAELTFSNIVDLMIEASDPGRDLKTAKLVMELSHDGISWLPAESYTQHKKWTVSSGFGTKQIYVRITDEAGNVSDIASATIIYRSIPKLNNNTVNAIEDTQYTLALSDFTYTNDDGMKPDSYTLVTLPEHGLLMLEDQEIKAGAVITADQLVKLVYVPQLHWFGTEQLVWNASADGVAAAADAVLTIEVAAVNDAPVVEDLDLTKTNFSPAEGTLAAKDIEGDTLTYHMVDAPSKGKVVLNTNTGAFTFTLDHNQNGTYAFTYRVFDGTDYSDTATVTIKYAVNIPITETPAPTHGVLKLGEQGPEISIEGQINDQGSSIEVHVTEEQLTSLNKSHENQTVELSLTGEYSDAKFIISDKALDKLAANGNSLLFVTPGLQYLLSNQDLKQMLTANRNSFVVGIKHEAGEVLTHAQEQAVKGAYQLIGAPITIELSARSEGVHPLQLQELGTIVLSSMGAGELPTALLKLLPNEVQSPVLATISIDGQSYQVHVTNYGAGTYTLIRKQPGFTDISGWSVAAIEKLASKLILNGVNESIFEPTRAITRAEFASIISKALGLVNISGSVNYTDVAAGAWYSDAVAAVAELGFMNGYPDGAYRPTQQITREETMVIVARVLDYLDSKNGLSDSEVDRILGGYSDLEQLSDWSRKDIAFTVREGIIMGNNGKLSVKDQVTREQVAAIIVRLLEYAEIL